MNKSPRMRTLPKAYREIKKIDPETDLSMRALRKLVGSGEIPSVKISGKILVNIDLVLEKLSCYNENASGA